MNEMNNPSLVYLFNKYLLSNYCGPDIVLGSGDTKMSNHDACLQGLGILVTGVIMLYVSPGGPGEAHLMQITSLLLGSP